jgi:hypothetical protein
MRRSASAAMIGAAAFLLVGCGDSHKKVFSDTAAATEEFAATLATCTDEASAKAAEPKLKGIIQKLRDIGARQKKLGKPSESEAVGMIVELGAVFKATDKLVAETKRIRADPKLQAVLKPTLDEWGKPEGGL